jgi:hypothetical protein
VALAQFFVRNYPLVWKAKVLGEWPVSCSTTAPPDATGLQAPPACAVQPVARQGCCPPFIPATPVNPATVAASSVLSGKAAPSPPCWSCRLPLGGPAAEHALCFPATATPLARAVDPTPA